MPASTTDLAATARALKRRHGALLAGECSLRETTAQRKAVEAVEAAQARLRGGNTLIADQLALNLNGAS